MVPGNIFDTFGSIIYQQQYSDRVQLYYDLDLYFVGERTAAALFVLFCRIIVVAVIIIIMLNALGHNLE